MITGKPILQHCYFNKESNDISKLFPENKHTFIVNQLFQKSIVEEERECLPDASALLEEVDRSISIIERHCDYPVNQIIRSCRVCGIGEYRNLGKGNTVDSSTTNQGGLSIHAPNFEFEMFKCTYCGHIDFFLTNKENHPLSPAWHPENGEQIQGPFKISNFDPPLDNNFKIAITKYLKFEFQLERYAPDQDFHIYLRIKTTKNDFYIGFKQILGDEKKEAPYITKKEYVEGDIYVEKNFTKKINVYSVSKQRLEEASKRLKIELGDPLEVTTVRMRGSRSYSGTPIQFRYKFTF